MAEQNQPGATNFGNFTISGGIQNFGGTNTNQQSNVYQSAEREQFQELLDLVKAHATEFRDGSLAADQIVLIERQLAHPDPAAGGARVRGALEALAGNVNAGSTLAEALARAVGLVMAHWPF